MSPIHLVYVYNLWRTAKRRRDRQHRVEYEGGLRMDDYDLEGGAVESMEQQQPVSLFQRLLPTPTVSPPADDEPNAKGTLLDTLGISVGYLMRNFVQEVLDAGFTRSSSIYDIEEFVIRKKGTSTICPLDGRPGASYVHSLGQDPATVRLGKPPSC